MISCFIDSVRGLLHGLNLNDDDDDEVEVDDDVDVDVNADSESESAPDVDAADFSSIKAATAYFRALPERVTAEELGGNGECEMERVLAFGRLFKAESPSTACRSPDNLAKFIEDEESDENEAELIVLAERGDCTFYDKTRFLSDAKRIVKGAVIGNTAGSIFTMGTDGVEEPLDLTALMIDKLSFDALSVCTNKLDNNELMAEMVEIMTRCDEEKLSQLNVHGANTHFTVSSQSNTLFVVHQEGETFKISLPQNAKSEGND